MSRTRRLRAVTGAAVLLLAGGCTDPEPAPRPAPSDPGTPLASYAARDVVVERAPFCDSVPDEAVEESLGGPPAKQREYGNGQRARLAPGLRDVSHEFGCAWSSGRTSAAAWVFAPPVTRSRARDLVEEARGGRGCQPDDEAPAFGAPSVALLCTGGGTATASYRGLFGDAWLACSLTVPMAGLDRPALADRAGRWCVAVAEAAAVV